MTSLPTCIIILLHAKFIAMVVDPTSTSSHYSRSSYYDRHILLFVDVEVKECIKHVSDKEEEETKKNRGSYIASMHGSTLTIINVLSGH